MLKQLIGTLYFSAGKDKDGRFTSQYEGTVAGLIIRKDDGTEVMLREEKTVNKTEIDIRSLKVGQPLESLDGKQKYTVEQVFPSYGTVAVLDEQGEWLEKDFTSLRRPA